MIARKYGLTHIVVFTNDDKQHRSRIIYWAKNEKRAVQLATFCKKMADELGWTIVYDWDCSSVRKLKDRIKTLEMYLAMVHEREGDPVDIAKIALNLPKDI